MTSSRTRESVAPWMGLVGGLVLVAAAFAVPAVTGWDVAARAPSSHPEWALPPIHGYWQPKLLGPGTLPAVLLAVLGWLVGPRLAQRLSWRSLLAVSYAAGLAWMLALALVDGSHGLSRVLDHRTEYLPTAREVDDIGRLLQGYTERIPYSSDDNWPTQIAGHPPLILLFFVALVRVGLGSSLEAGIAVTVVAATIALAVLVTVRALGDEAAARRTAPYLVLTPAAVFLSVSGDAVIAAVAAWGLACLAIAATRPRRSRLLAWSVLAGLLLGSAVMMSYGLPLIGLVALAILFLARSWLPLPVAAAAALVVVLGFAAAGFAWWEAYPVLHDRYWDGIAKDRPASYWMWGNLAALLLSAGPLLAAGLARAAVVRPSRDGVPRTLWVLAGAALAIVVLADLSRMSKAEVERIWLPFIPWLTLSVGLLPQRWLRWGLALQLVSALVVQQLLYTSW